MPWVRDLAAYGDGRYRGPAGSPELRHCGNAFSGIGGSAAPQFRSLSLRCRFETIRRGRFRRGPRSDIMPSRPRIGGDRMVSPTLKSAQGVAATALIGPRTTIIVGVFGWRVQADRYCDPNSPDIAGRIYLSIFRVRLPRLPPVSGKILHELLGSLAGTVAGQNVSIGCCSCRSPDNSPASDAVRPFPSRITADLT